MPVLTKIIERLLESARALGGSLAHVTGSMKGSSRSVPDWHDRAHASEITPPSDDGRGPAHALKSGIEQLKDLQWELRDSEARFRDLLDNQSDIIARRDPTGCLTFVNRAFCRSFGVEPADVIGTTFQPHVLHDAETPRTPESGRLRRIEQQVATAAGPRWFTFEQRTVVNPDGTVSEVQTIGHDVTDQRRIQAELAETRDQAMAANSAKSRFLAAMSHEIRTPMNGILGMTGLLIETAMSAEQRSYANAIDLSAKTLLTIIDEILDLSKIEAGKLEIHPVTFPIDDCAQSVIELLAPKAFEKSLELVWRLDPDVPNLLVGDETRIRQVLLNLVGNAIKFTDQGGVVVRISCKKDTAGSQAGSAAMTLIIEVRDTGIGLSKDQLVNLFTEFEQVADVKRRKRGGTGLGLAISQRLANAMGGDISVASEPGRGSIFTARLQLSGAPGCRPIAPSPQHCVGRNVLLALSGAIERKELADGLTAIHIAADAVAIGDANAEIERAAKRLAYDTVVIDATAGPETAGAILAHARAQSRRPVRGIVLIDQVGRKALLDFRSAGFDAYLIRPVRPQSLLAQLLVSDPSQWSAPAKLPQPMARMAGTVVEAARPRSILMVEDNDINALLARRVMERAGCSVQHAKSGLAALDYCQSIIRGHDRAMDVVLMDIHMPDMDGYEVTSCLKRLFAGAGRRPPPIIAITANAFAEDRKRCLEAGLDDFLAKPFERSELEAILDKWCGAPSTSRDGALDEFAA